MANTTTMEVCRDPLWNSSLSWDTDDPRLTDCLQSLLELSVGSLLLICAYGGLVVYAYYHDCDPIKSRQVAKKDQLFPLFVMQVMGDIPGVPGLFVAGVFSGALSTVSSGLNSLAAVCLKDFFGSGCNLKLSEDRAALVTKILAVVFGVIGYGIVFLVKYLPGVLEV